MEILFLKSDMPSSSGKRVSFWNKRHKSPPETCSCPQLAETIPGVGKSPGLPDPLKETLLPDKGLILKHNQKTRNIKNIIYVAFKVFGRHYLNHFPGNRGLCAGICLCLLFSPLAGTTIHDILHAPTSQRLQTHLKKHRALSFQKTLCEKQLEINAIPYACYPFPELRKVADFHCLELGIKNVTLSSLKKALFFQLSVSCRKHLKNFEKILLYRKKAPISLIPAFTKTGF